MSYFMARTTKRRGNLPRKKANNHRSGETLFGPILRYNEKREAYYQEGREIAALGRYPLPKITSKYKSNGELR